MPWIVDEVMGRSARAAARVIVGIEVIIGSTHIGTGTGLMRSTNIVRFLSQLGMSLEESLLSAPAFAHLLYNSGLR